MMFRLRKGRKGSAQNAAGVFTVVAVAETLIGVAFLLGFLVRPASIGGMIMNSFFYLAAGFSSSSTAGVNLVILGAQLSMLLLSTGRVVGIDGLIAQEVPSNPTVVGSTSPLLFSASFGVFVRSMYE